MLRYGPAAVITQTNAPHCFSIIRRKWKKKKKCPIAVVVFCHSILIIFDILIMMIQARRMRWFANGLWLCRGGEEAAGKLLTREIDVRGAIVHLPHWAPVHSSNSQSSWEFFIYVFLFFIFATWNSSSSMSAPAAAINSKISVCLLHGVSFHTDTRSR